MSSPLEDAAREFARNERLPDAAWLQRRHDTITDHAESVYTVADALTKMSRLILNSRISTSILKESRFTEFAGTIPSQELGYMSLSVIPSLEGVPQDIPTGLGYSWTPDVAMQVNFLFKDQYKKVKTATGKALKPTGNTYMQMLATTWGRLLPEEINGITDLTGISQIEAFNGDVGHSRRGARVIALCYPGETITNNAAETILAPLAGHVVEYFNLVGRPHLAKWQKPGNFSSHAMHSNNNATAQGHQSGNHPHQIDIRSALLAPKNQ